MLTRRALLRSVAIACIVANLWRLPPAFAQPGFDDDWPDYGDDDDDGDDDNDIPEPPPPPDPVDTNNSGGLGDSGRSQIDLATGARSFDGPLLQQATSDPGQWVDSIFSGIFLGTTKQEKSALDGDLDSGRLLVEATSLAPAGGRASEKDIFSLDASMAFQGERKAVTVGFVGGFYQSSPEGNTQTLGVFAGDGVGVWASGTATNEGGKTEFTEAAGIFIGVRENAEVFIGLDSSWTVEVGVVTQGGAVEVGISLPALRNWAETEVGDLQRNIENLYGIPH